MHWSNEMKWLTVWCLWLLTGCIYAPLPELPVIDHISQPSDNTEAKDGNKNTAEAITKHPQPRDSPIVKSDASTSQCPSLPMPEPIPKQMRIEIGYGADKADDNGIRLLENYKDLRKKIKATWHAKPP
jgi:hypothetical protein